MVCTKVSRLMWGELQKEKFRDRTGSSVLRLKGSGFYRGLDRYLGKNFPEEPLFVVQYSYGDLMVKDGTFQTPCNPAECENCRALAEALWPRETESPGAALTIPLTFVMQGCAEVSLRHPFEEQTAGLGAPAYKNAFHTLPLTVIDAGEPFGVFEVLDHLFELPAEKPAWQVSAGIRSIHILAPLKDEERMVKMTGKRSVATPRWQMVQETIKKVFPREESWSTKVLVLPARVVNEISYGNAPELHSKLLEMGWLQSAPLRTSATRDGQLLRRLRRTVVNTKLPEDELYYYFTIRHWLNMIKGLRPVFMPISRFPEEQGGPFDRFLSVLQTVIETGRFGRGGQKVQYNPIILRPGFLKKEGDIGYYSIRVPTATELPGSAAENGARTNYRQILMGIDAVIQNSGDKEVCKLYKDTTKLFVARPRKEKSVEQMEGIVYADQLPLAELQDKNAQGQVYWDEPFFVAGMRLQHSPGNLLVF